MSSAAQQAIVGQIRMLGARGVGAGVGAAAAASAGAARAASSTSAAAAAAASPLADAPTKATITLPSGRALELADGDIKLTMPPEWAPHAGAWIAWPVRTDVWRCGAAPARKAFADVIGAIAQFEPVTVIADPSVVRSGCAEGEQQLQRRRGAVVFLLFSLLLVAARCLLVCMVLAGRRGARATTPTHGNIHPKPHPPLLPMATAAERSGPTRARRCPTRCAWWRCATTTRGCATRGRRCECKLPGVAAPRPSF